MRDYDDVPYIVIERHSAGVAPFVWGALIGAGIALFMAPRSGEETQEEIRQRVRRMRDSAEGRVNDVRDSFTGAVSRTRGRMRDQIDSARDAVDSGRQAARDARRDLEERVASVKGGRRDEGRPMESMDGPDVVITEVTIEEEEIRPDLG
ncbi:MAG TPA: YtxH domain-containing protein [Longimicrobiaceae bacterium]|nr:YtxH domain-containing protein [Longimicrobiaceae bacterium]